MKCAGLIQVMKKGLERTKPAGESEARLDDVREGHRAEGWCWLGKGSGNE